MKLRWYKHIHYDWKWDSRHDCLYKFSCKQEYRLQYMNELGEWIDVPHVVEETEDPKPDITSS